MKDTTKGRIIALFIAVAFVASIVAAAPPDHAKGKAKGIENAPSGESKRVGNAQMFCEAHGFSVGIAKWEATGGGFTPEGNPMGTSVSGTPSEFDWDVGSSGATAIIVKAGQLQYVVTGTSGTVEQDKPETSVVTFCGDELPSMTCQEALDSGLLTATLENGVATVTNDAPVPIEMSLVSYEMYGDHFYDQLLYDSNTFTVGAGDTVTESVDTPDSCNYQAELICGDILEWTPDYMSPTDRAIDDEINTDADEWCTPEPTGDVELSIDEHYPKDIEPEGQEFLFRCTADYPDAKISWYFGDGDVQLADDDPADNVIHAYLEPGDYTVACTAVNEEHWGADTLDITVE